MPSARPPFPTDWRRFPMGAEPAPGGGVHFRVWAPRRKTVAVVLGDAEVATGLSPEAGGYFSGLVRDASAGSTYRFLLDDEITLADPASRFQPEGPHGPSMVIDPASYRWQNIEWQGVAPARRVLYEMHVGTFYDKPGDPVVQCAGATYRADRWRCRSRRSRAGTRAHRATRLQDGRRIAARHCGRRTPRRRRSGHVVRRRPVVR